MFSQPTVLSCGLFDPPAFNALVGYFLLGRLLQFVRDFIYCYAWVLHVPIGSPDSEGSVIGCIGPTAIIATVHVYHAEIICVHGSAPFSFAVSPRLATLFGLPR